ncbi:unnamed protein product [Dracunculus medinensis]|uniref:C2H2-type domain-containing protein n=1 Tax=Dracunculus medinensis TaxID=318479 RepID=A0A0N4U6D4_DRAME|nr:unnamed protein product [Dracunculus medinensis]
MLCDVVFIVIADCYGCRDRHRNCRRRSERNSGSINNNNNEGPMECDDAATESSEQIASSGHAKNSTILNNHAAQLVNQVISRTQCTECGKHFRKGSSLQVHMTLNHGFPPPGSSLSSDDQGEKGSDCGAPMIDQTNGNTESTTPPIHQEIREIKNKIDEMRSAQSATRVEQVLSGLDTRVGRLEKQLEMALNSIYTIVQLQTGINSSVTRFKDEISEQLKAIRTILNESAT